MGYYDDLLKDYRAKNGAADNSPAEGSLQENQKYDQDYYANLLKDYRSGKTLSFSQPKQVNVVKPSGSYFDDDTAQQQQAENSPAPNASVHPGGGTALSALTSALGKIVGQDQRFQQGIQQRREQSLSELNALTEAAPYVASAEEGAQNAARRRELTKSLEASDAILGNDPRYYDEASRWAGVANGNLQGLAGGYLSAAGTLAQRGTQDEIGQILNDSVYSGYMTDPLAIEQMRQAVENGWRPESIGVYDDVDKVIQKGDQLLDSSRETTAKAKNGADKTQNLLIDMSGSATGMAADKALVALTGLKPLGLVNMGIRTFGEGAYEARKQGLDANKQVAAGVSSAISELGPELIFGGMSEIYGNSAAKKIGGDLLKKVAPKLTSKIASSQGLSLLFDLAGRFGGESIEEMSSNVVKPVLDRLFGVEKYKKFWDFAIKDGKLDDDFVANTLYEGLLGGIMGVLGGGAENVQTYARYGTVSKAEVEAAQKAMLEGAEAAMDRAIEKKAAEQPSEAPSAKPTLAEPKTDAQKRVANLVNGATTQEQLAEVLQKIQGSPALDAALEELTGMDAEAHLARSAQEATGDVLAPEGTETPEVPVEARTEAPAELNSGNATVESGEPVQADQTAPVDTAPAAQAETIDSESDLPFTEVYTAQKAAKDKASAQNAPESSAEYFQQNRLTRKDFESRETERGGIEDEYKAENAEANEEIAHDEAYEKAKSDAEKLADAKKAYGEAIHKKLIETAKKLKGLVGNSRVTERGNEGFTYREGGKDIESFAHVFNEFAAGRQTFRQLADAYAKLNSPSNEKKGSYFYDEIFGGQFETLAEAFENGDYTRKDGTIDPDFARRVEELSRRVTHRFEYMQKMLAFRDHLSQVYEGEGAFKTKAGMLAKALEAANRFQLRPSTAFKMLSGYNKKGGYAWYQLADMARDATKSYINTFQTAQDYLRDLTERKDWSDFSTGKTTVKNVIPGLKYGERLSANAALSFLKMLETKGSYDHIIRNGLVEMARTEKELYSGKNNNGFGDATGYSQTFDPISKETRAKLDSAKTAKEKAAAWNQARAELDALKGALRSEIESAPAAKAAYEASFAPLNFLAKALNKTSRTVWGSDVAVQGKFYWPLEAGGKRLGQELLNDHNYGLDQYRNVQERTGDRGGLMVRPFTDVMQGYIRNASHWAAYQELSDTLHILSKDFRGTQSITQLLNDNAGKPWSKWLENYEADLNGTRGKDKGWASKVIGGLRSNLAQSSLLLNAGVAMKQAPSGLDFMTVLDADIVAKRFATGALRSARSFSNNPLIQTMEQYSKMLKNRQAGYNTVETGEATEVGRKGAINKFVAKLPSWMTNWITKTDYRTVANGLLACEDQVKRNIKNGVKGYADIKVGSDEYYQAIADLFENAVMDTQPIYNKEYRAEALRTDNEMLRTLGMFRTQQTQNYNNLVETIGEFKAAKASGDAKEIASARNRMARTIGGQVSAAVMFAMLDGAAKLMLHKKKQYEDEEGELDANKFMQKAGWNMLSSLVGTSWLGSKVAPFLINNASNMLNVATGGKVSKAEIYNGAVDGTLGMVDDFANALKSFNEKPSLKTGKSLVLTFSSMIGLPTRNAYNLLNAAAMYGIDFGMKGLNVKNEDDIINLLNGYYGAAASTRGKQAVDRALALAKNGHDDQADRIFSTLDPSDADLFKAAKNELKNAFVMGEISEQTYRDMLRKYFGANSQEVIKLVRAGKEKQADNEFTAAMQSKLGEDGYKEFADSMKQLNVETDPAGEKRFAAIKSLDLSDDYTDKLVQKYMGSNYADSYDALRSIGIKPGRANQILQSIDTDSAKSGFNVSQSELYDWLLDNPRDEHVVKAIWDSKGYKTEWSDYQESQAKNPVNILASYVGSRDKAEQAYKSMDSDGNGSLKQEEFFAYLKTHPEQEEALRAVFEAKWPKSNFDQKRRKYA